MYPDGMKGTQHTTPTASAAGTHLISGRFLSLHAYITNVIASVTKPPRENVRMMASTSRTMKTSRHPRPTAFRVVNTSDRLNGRIRFSMSAMSFGFST